jgi:hypothetical protein
LILGQVFGVEKSFCCVYTLSCAFSKRGETVGCRLNANELAISQLFETGSQSTFATGLNHPAGLAK